MSHRFLDPVVIVTDSGKVHSGTIKEDDGRQLCLMTSDGKFLRFDDPGNTKVVEMMKTNRDWSKSINDHQPVRVRVVGTPNGDVVVVQEIR